MRTTAEVVGHHLESMVGGDLEGLLSDYASDAVVITPSGTLHGTEEIKNFFIGFISSLPDGFIANMELDVNVADGEYGYIIWHSGDAAPLGTDTFHVVDGKFVMQTFAAYMPS